MKIKKTHKKSFFLKMHHNSHLADSLFEENPIFKQNPSYKSEPVDILQIHSLSETIIIVEIVYQKYQDNAVV